jgi:hypothetical protein
MLQQNILPEFNNKLERELVKLFHSLDLPLHFNKTGNKEFTNYQRISIIILFHKSKKSLREFIVEFQESKWVSWLGLEKIPKKSTLHDWIQIFSMKIVHKISKVLLPEKIELTSIDGTAFDPWQRSRHYEKRAEEMGKLSPMTPVKAGIFIDVKSQSIIDFEFVSNNQHDVKLAEKIFKRNTLKNIRSLGDRGFDSENLHEIARANGINFYAPLRKKHKWGSKNKLPGGFYRRKCITEPEDYNMRNINETVNSVLKRTQIPYLRSKKDSRKEKEFGWHVIWYNLKLKMMFSLGNEGQTFFCVRLEFTLSGQSLQDTNT